MAHDSIDQGIKTHIDSIDKQVTKLLADVQIKNRTKTKIRELKTHVAAVSIKVNDLIDSISLKRGLLPKKEEKFAPAECLKNICDVMLASKKVSSQVDFRHETSIPPEFKVWGDLDRLNQCILTLVEFCSFITERGSIKTTFRYFEDKE